MTTVLNVRHLFALGTFASAGIQMMQPHVTRGISGGDVTFIEGMKCHSIQIPVFAHPCRCFKENRPDPNDDHKYDYCEKSLPPLYDGGTSGVDIRCVDWLDEECPSSSSVYDCGIVWKCTTVCDSYTSPGRHLCHATDKGSCFKSYGTCHL